MFRNGRQVSYAGEHSRDWIEQLEPPYINEKATDYDTENRESEQIHDDDTDCRSEYGPKTTWVVLVSHPICHEVAELTAGHFLDREDSCSS
jgi:hypothetical protein